jgi:hypothetical protein
MRAAPRSTTIICIRSVFRLAMTVSTGAQFSQM